MLQWTPWTVNHSGKLVNWEEGQWRNTIHNRPALNHRTNTLVDFQTTLKTEHLITLVTLKWTVVNGAEQSTIDKENKHTSSPKLFCKTIFKTENLFSSVTLVRMSLQNPCVGYMLARVVVENWTPSHFLSSYAILLFLLSPYYTLKCILYTLLYTCILQKTTSSAPPVQFPLLQLIRSLLLLPL